MTDKFKKRPKRDFDDFHVWLAGLGMANPVLHVNGAGYTSAVLTVDFGTPLIEQKLDPDQNAELVTRMRAATKSLLSDKDVNIRVQSDGNNGIFWASLG